MISRILIALAAMPAIDSLVRLLLLWRSRSPERIQAGDLVRRWLVIIPSREEGELVRKTIESVRRAGSGRDVSTLLLLDGEDAAARRVADGLGAEVLRKDPSGPTKAAALAWLARTQKERVLASDAVLLLDVGSTVADRFFDELRWQAGCDAVQARLSGIGSGVGLAVAASERRAQLDEDRGRELFGWSVRLRGTGSAFRPQTFLEISPWLRTRVEDLEATLLIIARGQRVMLGGPDAMVSDEKPRTVYSAASQRARWLLGRYELLLKRGGEFVRALLRRPVETIALFFEIFGRPLSLTIPFRVVVASGVIVHSRGSGALAIIAMVILATAIGDTLSFFISSGLGAITAMRLMMVWVLAVFMAPRALFRWMRAKRL